jgi:cytochrome c oxidase subunit 3
MTEERVAMQFDSAAQQREAATLGMWVFLATEVMFFGGLIAAYVIYRLSHHDAFAAASGELHAPIGALNTAVLLTSSLTMALADLAAEQHQRSRLRFQLACTAAFGVVFLLIKAYEWHEAFIHKLVPFANGAFEFTQAPAEPAAIFFNLYFTLTGLHALHLLVGVLIIVWLLLRSLRRATLPLGPVRVSGLYWHFVDIVWVFLYPLLYLIH